MCKSDRYTQNPFHLLNNRALSGPFHSHPLLPKKSISSVPPYPRAAPSTLISPPNVAPENTCTSSPGNNKLFENSCSPNYAEYHLRVINGLLLFDGPPRQGAVP
ncbi:hypothetical protein NPIL_278031 [Nephila pilipes]|uniref:Uncharacterized protein n=1 Tax=Nephila pilipes TaxID=299642 RepID=A0A8X6QWC1_NEPPI|nr:hypothetical protein NPIL_278031 [Nephila pilipes]